MLCVGRYRGCGQVAAFSAGIDELQAIPKTLDNFQTLGPLWSVPSEPEALEDAAHPVWDGSRVVEASAAREQNSMSMIIGGSTAFDDIVRDPLMKMIHRGASFCPCRGESWVRELTKVYVCIGAT